MGPVVLDPAGFYRRVPLEPHQMVERMTPTKDVIVLCHLGVPRIEASAWRLSIGGLVERPATLDYAQLRAFPKHTVTSFHQCAGSPLAPAEPTRRVSNVTWSGARLGDVLAACRVRDEATFVWSAGADYGAFSDASVDAYLKDLPIDRIDSDVLLAYELNGAPLPAEHGFPVRLVVPGFYGTNSVKWLTEIRLETTRASGPFTTRWYNDPILDQTGRATGRYKPVWAIAPESVIVAPSPGAKLDCGVATEVWGWAWADGGAASIEVSVNGEALPGVTLETPNGRGWQRFAVSWTPRQTGAVRLASTAAAADGSRQPPEGVRNAIHHVGLTVV
jgi:DMSO/TMAO reductase YedYZ molybdopterin-dependent catalytic subunit